MSCSSRLVYMRTFERLYSASGPSAATFSCSYFKICLLFAKSSMHWEVAKLTMYFTELSKMFLCSLNPKPFAAVHLSASSLNLSRISLWLAMSPTVDYILPAGSSKKLTAPPSDGFAFSGDFFLSLLTIGLLIMAASLFLFFSPLDLVGENFCDGDPGELLVAVSSDDFFLSKSGDADGGSWGGYNEANLGRTAPLKDLAIVRFLVSRFESAYGSTLSILICFSIPS